jgi:flagellar basal body-associated protein FliL
LQSPLPSPLGRSDPSGTEDPLTAEVPNKKKKRNQLDIWIIVVVIGSTVAFILACAAIMFLLVKWTKYQRLHESMSLSTTPAANRRYGMVVLT